MKAFAELITKYLGKPFKPGAKGPDSFDCFGLVYDFYKQIGIDIPTEYEDCNIDNGYIMFAKDSLKVEHIMLELFKTVGTDIPIGEQIAGDIIIMQTLGHFYPTIYLGNNLVLAATPKRGVIAVSIDEYNYPKMIRRLE
jgi:cell wall-associated NlpC family hydrolase